MKKAMLLVSLLLAAMLLMGCSAQNENFPDASANMQKDPLTVVTTDAPAIHVSAEMDYDPMAEEDVNTYVAGALYDEYGNTLYAGATPIPLDPIDMPTATPRPSLTFSYGVANVDHLNISFEAPVGWVVDTSAVSSGSASGLSPSSRCRARAATASSPMDSRAPSVLTGRYSVVPAPILLQSIFPP